MLWTYNVCHFPTLFTVHFISCINDTLMKTSIQPTCKTFQLFIILVFRYHDQQRCLNSITKPVEFIISLRALTLLLSLKAIIESHLVNKWNPGKVDKRDHLFHSLMFQAFRYPGSLVWRWFFFCRVFQLAEIFHWLLMISMEVLLVHPFSVNVKVSEKLKFLTLWHAHIRRRVMR